MTEHINYTFNSNNFESTEHFAEKIGSCLKGGEIIELIGDVGAGKTTFVRGLSRGMGSKDRVASPTFTVSRIYNSDKLSLYHYDFYRLDDFEIIKNELSEVLSEKKNSVVLEWADEIKGVLDPDRISIMISVTGDQSRQFDFLIPKRYSYLKESL